jgi:small multidrug resistance pump
MAPSVLIFVFYSSCLIFLTLALRTIPVSVTYAVWSALGTAIIAAVGVICFQETVTPLKVASLAVIILGVIGLNLAP